MVSILLVDDEPSLLEVASTFLRQKSGFSVHEASSADEARERMQNHQYDVIVSDYEMPGEDGLSFLKSIRSSGSRIPFIIFTGRGREEVAIEALNSGADYYLQKGGKPGTVFAELANFIWKTYQKKKAEQDLIASEIRYRAVVENQSEMICRFSPDWRLIFANEAFLRRYGIFSTDELDTLARTIVPEDDLARIRSTLMHLASNPGDGGYGESIHRVRLPGEEIYWQHWVFTAIRDENDAVFEYQSVGRDITEKKKMEIAAAEQLNYIQALMDTIPAPIFFRDNGGVYRDCNQAFENLVGRSRDEIIGRVIHDFFPRELADHYRFMDDLIIAHPYVQQYEYVITNKAGERFDVLFSKTALISAEGTVKGIVGVIFDISERKKFEQIVFENEEKYRTLAEYTHDWESWMSPDQTYQYVSPSCERITGYTAAEFIEDPGLAIAITHPDDRETVQEHYRKYQEPGAAVSHIDYRIITRKGEERWVSHICKPVFRDDGTWLGMRENKRDITLRKEIEKELQQANLKLNLLSSITRHDILNQLTALIGYADLAREMTSDPALSRILARLQESATAISEQMAFTRMYQDLGKNDPVWQYVRDILSRAAKGVLIPLIEVDPSLERIAVRADPLIEKVFFCLLDNSVRHGKTVTRVRFSGRSIDDRLILVYEDDGVGVEDGEKEQIFRTTKRELNAFKLR